MSGRAEDTVARFAGPLGVRKPNICLCVVATKAGTGACCPSHAHHFAL